MLACRSEVYLYKGTKRILQVYTDQNNFQSTVTKIFGKYNLTSLRSFFNCPTRTTQESILYLRQATVQVKTRCKKIYNPRIYKEILPEELQFNMQH